VRLAAHPVNCLTRVPGHMEFIIGDFLLFAWQAFQCCIDEGWPHAMETLSIASAYALVRLSSHDLSAPVCGHCPRAGR
jgi:hypothetical protein